MRVVDIVSKIKGHKTLVNGTLFSLYSFIGKGISFLILLLLAKYLSPTEYGLLNLFNTIVMFVSIFMGLSTNGYISVSYFKKKTNDFKQDFTSIIAICFGTLLFFTIVLVFGGQKISALLYFDEKLLWMAVVISFSTFLFLAQQDYYRIKEKIKLYGIYNISNAVFNLLLTIFFVSQFGQNWYGRVNAQLLCSVMFGIIAIAIFKKEGLLQCTYSSDRFKEILKWGMPMIPHHATGWIRQGVDRYIINYYYSAYSVGVFSFALNISNIIMMIGSAFNATNSVSLFQILSNCKISNDEKFRQLNKQSQQIRIIYLLATIFVIVFSSIICYAFFPKYIESVPLMWILSISAYFNCLYFLYCNFLFYYSKTKSLMYITLGISFIHFCLSLVITSYSLYGTAILYTLGQFAMFVLVRHKGLKLVRTNFKI